MASAKDQFFALAIEQETRGLHRDMQREINRHLSLMGYPAEYPIFKYVEPPAPERWKCDYCQGTHPEVEERCYGCGAPRKDL